MNWVGGVTNADAAASLLSQGGIPTTSIVSGGKIVKFRIETVWVEAWLNYYPSRGAKHKPYTNLADAQARGTSWVPMDASFKQYTYTEGLNIKANVAFHAQTLIDQAKVGATINEGEGWVQNLNQANIQSQLTAYQNQVKAYIDAQRPNATVGDVIGNKVIVAATPSMIAGTLSYALRATANRYAMLPENLRHKIEFKFYANESAQQLDSPAFVVSRGLPSVANKRVSLTYDFATPADEQVISDAANAGQGRFLPYLVRVKPTLRINDQVVMSGTSVTVGTRQLLSVSTVAPSFTQDRDYKLLAGDFFVLGVNAAGVSYDQWNARLTTNDLQQGIDPNTTIEMLYQVLLGWWTQKYAFNDGIGAVNNVVSYQFPSHAGASAPVAITYFLGVPKSATYRSRVLDAKADIVLATHKQANAESLRQYAMTAGQLGSFLEASIFDQAFLMSPGHSMSTMTLLKANADAGGRTYTITSANLNNALAAMQTDADTKQDIRNAIGAGMRVRTSQNELTIDGATRIGYIVEDPQTGAAAYLINGGTNGGSSPTAESVFPLPDLPRGNVIGLLAGGFLRSAGAAFVVKEGLIVGIAIPAAEGAAAGAAAGAATVAASAIVAAVILVLLLLTAVIVYVETKYPRRSVPWRLRHYTSLDGAIAIVASKFFLETIGGTFGNGVYFASADSEDAKAAGCPPNALDVATRFQIPSATLPPNPTSATSFVEIRITRENLYQYGGGVNSNGETEITIKAPLLPTGIRSDTTGSVRNGLYFGTYALGVEQGTVCIP
jgi:hypothetical protein